LADTLYLGGHLRLESSCIQVKYGITLCYVSTDGKGIERSAGKIGQDIKTEIVKSVHVFGSCTKIHIRYNIFISRKSWCVAVLWP